MGIDTQAHDSICNKRLLNIEIQDRLPKNSIDPGWASVNRNSWGGDPESLGTNRCAYYPRDQSLFVYY